MTISRRKSLGLLAGGTGLLGAACRSEQTAAPFKESGKPLTAPPRTPLTPGVRSTSLKDYYRNNFRFGLASQTFQLENTAPESPIIQAHFNSITAEYQMKPDQISSAEGVYNFAAADQIVDFAVANGMDIRGHALLWHQTTPDYFLTGSNAQIKRKLETYIGTVVDRYKGRVYCWDVVNEVVAQGFEPASQTYRNSNWFQAVGGAQYIDWAFNAAREADPNCLLCFNDYSTEDPDKRVKYIAVLQDLIARNIPVDVAGHQMHINMDTPIPEMRAAIDDVDGLFAGLENHVTELDMSFYNDPGSCWERQAGCDADVGPTPPYAMLELQAKRYKEIFNMLVTRSSVTSVTMWGLEDGQSWLNGLPVQRSNHPLLFDRDLNPKMSVTLLSDPAY